MKLSLVIIAVFLCIFVVAESMKVNSRSRSERSQLSRREKNLMRFLSHHKRGDSKKPVYDDQDKKDEDDEDEKSGAEMKEKESEKDYDDYDYNYEACACVQMNDDWTEYFCPCEGEMGYYHNYTDPDMAQWFDPATGCLWSYYWESPDVKYFNCSGVTGLKDDFNGCVFYDKGGDASCDYEKCPYNDKMGGYICEDKGGESTFYTPDGECVAYKLSGDEFSFYCRNTEQEGIWDAASGCRYDWDGNDLGCKGVPNDDKKPTEEEEESFKEPVDEKEDEEEEDWDEEEEDEPKFDEGMDLQEVNEKLDFVISLLTEKKQ